jgi:hypothetical protein
MCNYGILHKIKHRKNKQTMQMYMILYLIAETKYMERCSIRKQKKSILKKSMKAI